LLAGFLGAGLRLGLVLRVAVLVPVFFAGPREVLVVRVEDVLLLRDPGGEDVRVAMCTNLHSSHSRHMDPRSVSSRPLSARSVVEEGRQARLETQ
jgi:hypothetical protein